MRRLTLLLSALLLLGASVAAAQSAFPSKIALPNGFAPEGIEISGNTFYVGSVGSGAVYVGDLRTGQGDVVVPGAPGARSATGLELEGDRLWVSGARFGNALVYNARTGALLEQYQLATGPGATFINDAVVTRSGVFFTDSQRAVIYKVAPGGIAAPGSVSTIELGGDYEHVAGMLNLNGIVATADGKTLIAVQTAAKKLLTIDPETGVASEIDLGGYDLVNGDGLLLHGLTLYVVQNRSNQVAVFRLSPDLTTATLLEVLRNPDLDVPTTIDRSGNRLYVVNARFGTTTPTDQAYHVVRLR